MQILPNRRPVELTARSLLLLAVVMCLVLWLEGYIQPNQAF
jgi:hypothetical protein